MNTSQIEGPLDPILALALLSVGIYVTHAKVFNLTISEGQIKSEIPSELDELVVKCIHLLTQIGTGTASGEN